MYSSGFVNDMCKDFAILTERLRKAEAENEQLKAMQNVDVAKLVEFYKRLEEKVSEVKELSHQFALEVLNGKPFNE